MTREQIDEHVLCNPDLDPVVQSALDTLDAGIDHLCFHWIGGLRRFHRGVARRGASATAVTLFRRGARPSSASYVSA